MVSDLEITDFFELTRKPLADHSNSSRGFYQLFKYDDISYIMGTSISQYIALFASLSKFLVAN